MSSFPTTVNSRGSALDPKRTNSSTVSPNETSWALLVRRAVLDRNGVARLRVSMERATANFRIARHPG